MSQRGFLLPALPLMAYGAIAAAVVIVGLSVAVKVQTSRLGAVKAEYGAFKERVKVLGQEAERKAKEKEKADAAKIQTAVSERDAALRSLRNRPRGSHLSDNSASAAAGSTICLPTATYNAAMGDFGKRLERFMADTWGYSQEGDAAQIDAQTLLKGWPQ